MAKGDYSFKALSEVVLEQSEASFWKDAVAEWDIDSMQEDLNLSESCICGHPHLRYLYRICNRENGNMLFPIGSECIKRFGRDDFDEQVSILEGMHHLYAAIMRREYIRLNSDYFTRRLLRHLYDAGAFQANQYNRFDPEIDYNFMLDMFNKRDKSSISQSQKKKINAIILFSIKPFLKDNLRFLDEDEINDVFNRVFK